jgi:hypothetical protein
VLLTTISEPQGSCSQIVARGKGLDEFTLEQEGAPMETAISVAFQRQGGCFQRRIAARLRGDVWRRMLERLDPGLAGGGTY